MDYRSFSQATSNAVTPSVPTQPESSLVRDGLTRAEQLCSELHEELNRLEQRLDTVLRPLPPQGQAAGKQELPGPVSHVVGRLHILIDGHNGAIARLRDLTARIEV